METISSSTLQEDADVNEEVNVIEEPSSPAVTRPAHTSPDLGFASEVVDCHTVTHTTRERNLKLIFKFCPSRACSDSSSWRLRIWLPKTTKWAVWWKARATPTQTSPLGRKCLRVTWSRRISTRSGMKCMRCVDTDVRFYISLNITNKWCVS